MFLAPSLLGRARLPWSRDTLATRTSPPTPAGPSFKICENLQLGSRQANAEPFRVGRVTTRDVTDFKDGLRREQGQAVATINRALVTLRRFFGWLVDQGHAKANPVKPVKELRKQQLAPKGMERGEVRRLLREIELRQDVRANAIFHLFLYTGCRISDLVALELHDLMIGERSGSVVFRLGKGGKQRSVPLPLPARRAVPGISGNPAADPIQQGLRR